LTQAETYGYPKGFKYDEKVNEDKFNGIQDDPTLANYNYNMKCAQIVDYVQSLANG
jgi:hypothetical protein